MQPHQLEYFLAVAETGSFTRGAEQAGVVQSAVSTAVKQLEHELGVALIERGYHRLALTPEGEALLPRAREVLSSFAAAKDAVASARGTVVGTVVLGTLAYTGRFDIGAALQRCREAYPQVAVHLRQTFSGSASSIDQVRTGDLDLALVATQGRVAGIEFHEIGTERLVFVCSPGHPLARARSVSVTDLGEEPFVDYPTGWGNRTTVDLAFAAAGVRRTVSTEVTDFPLARSLVARGLGVTILPEHAVPVDGGAVAVPLAEDLRWVCRLAISSERPLSRAADRVAAMLLGT
ncbi:MAG: LysR family transcriptional regulator [Nocardioides sp.]